MKSAEIGIAARRSAPVVPLMVAVGVIASAIGSGLAWRGVTTSEVGGRTATPIEWTAQGVQGWGFVLNADRAQVLRHRPGLEPVDLVRTRAFGWQGPTIADVLHNPSLIKELRMHPGLTLEDLIRTEARGH